MSRHRIQHYHVHHDDPRQHHFNLTLADQIAPRGYISWIFALPAVGVREAHHRSAVFQRVSLIVHAMYATDRFLRRYVVQRTEPTSYIDILTQNMARNDCTGVVELTDIEPTMPNASDLAKRTALPSGDASGLVPMPSQAERGHSSWLAPAEVFSPGCKTARLGYGSLPDPVPQRVFRVLVGFGIDTFNLTFQLHHSVGDDYCLTFLIEDFAARSLNDDDQLRQVTEARPYDSDRRDRYPHEDKQAAGPLESHEYVHRGDSYVTTDDFAERRGRSHYNSAYRYHQELSTLNLSLSIIAMSLAHVSTVTPSGFNPFAQMQHAIGTPPRNQSNMRLVILDALLWANITRARVSTGELAGGQDAGDCSLFIKKSYRQIVRCGSAMFCKRDDVRPEYNFCNWWVWCRATLPIHLLCAAASLNPKAFRKVLVKIARLRRLNDDFLNHKAIQLFNKVDRLPEKRQIQPAMTYGRDVVIENPIAPLQHLQFGIPFCQSPRAAAGKSSPTDILKAIPAGREGTVVILPPTQKGGLKLQFSLREEQWAYLLADEDFQALSVEDGEAGARL